MNLRWRVEVTEDPNLEKALQQQAEEYRQHGMTLFAGLHPLAIGDKILMRTTSEVLAVDFQTGKRLWPTEKEEDPATADSRPSRFNGLWIGPRYNMSQPAQYGQRIWDDAAYGTLSSDGQRLFVIEELPLGVTGPMNGFMMAGGRNDPSNRSVTNKLVAYDIHGDGQPGHGGKMLWKVGGPDSLGPKELKDAFFLGPPLPLHGQLYVMAEIKDELRLIALDAVSGKWLWSQQLCMVDNISQDPIRRLAGVSPSYSDGVLVCPTGAGCIVAVDLASHSLLWGYVYSRPGEQGAPRRMRGVPFPNAFMNSSNGPIVNRWLDGTAVIVNGRVLVTPAEADALYCLNLSDGKPVWPPKPRNEAGEHGEPLDRRYIASVYKGAVVVAGRSTMEAVNLEDGGKAWGGRIINVPSGATVCGHGCCAGGQYFLPISSGEVLSIDLESGKVVATAKSRPGTMYSRSAAPGNLICYRGRVISQGLDGLEVYYQADVAREEVVRRLAANPDNVEGLTLRGEMLLDAGKSAEAVADFRRAFGLDKKSDSHGRTRELLRDALLTGLRDDFAAHRSMAGEVEPLLDDAAQRATYCRYMAAGFQGAGRWQEAVNYYLKLLDSDDAKAALEKVDRSHLVRRDRWVEARLGLLRKEAGAAVLAQLDRALAQRLDEAKLDTGLEGLNRFLASFGNQPQAAAARSELLDRLTRAGRILEAELVMTAAADSTDRKAQAALLAEMAELDLHANRVSDAAAWVRQLQSRYADVPCREGTSPAQWLAALPHGEELRREVDRSPPAWPLGEVEAGKPEGVENPMGRSLRFDMLFGGPSGPFFSDCTMAFDNRQEVSVRDGLGNLKARVPLSANGRGFNVFGNMYSSHARSCGHLLVISAGSKICALDPWRVSGNSSPILWCKDLSDTGAENNGNIFVFNGGMDRDFRANPFGPVNARYVCFQRRRSIVAVDPANGEPLWERQDIPSGSEVFGDEQYVLVAPPRSDEATVYRAIDGQLLGTRKLPRARADDSPFGYGVWRGGSSALSTSGIDFVGRYVVTWEQGGENKNRQVLALFDPWLKKAVWPSRSFAAGARVALAGEEAAAVLEPDGRFVLVALSDGSTLADLFLERRPQVSVTDFVVTRMGDQYIVAVNGSRVAGNNNGDEAIHPMQGMFCYPLNLGRIYALDLKGKLAWPAPVNVDHQHLLLSQPGRLPVLCFATFHVDPRGGGMTNQRVSLVAVDRRNGRIVYDHDFPGPIHSLGAEIHGDPADHTVNIATDSQTVRLTFTDKPIKSTVRHSTGVRKAPGKLGEALWDAAVRGVGNALNNRSGPGR